MQTKRHRLSARWRRILTLCVLAAVGAAAILLFVFRDAISARISGAGAFSEDETEPWTIESGSGQTFASLGNSLAVVSSTGVQLMEYNGVTTVREIFSLGTPAVVSTGEIAAVWDVGGKTLRLMDKDGNFTDVAVEKELLAVSLTQGGYLAVSTREAGYKGLVTVYDPKLTPVYKWHSGSGYLLSADVSPDGKSLAALTCSDSGGAVHFFSLSSEEELGLFQSPDELFVDICWMDETLCALSEKRAVFLDGTGKELASYDFGGMYLTGYAFGGDGFAALALSEYLSGGDGVAVTVSAAGEELGRAETAGDVKYICASGAKAALLTQSGARVYSKDMTPKGESGQLTGARAIILRPRGDALIIGAYQAEVWNY